jgi:hypothetical protein
MMMGSTAKKVLEATWERLSAGSVSSDVENDGEENANTNTTSTDKEALTTRGSAADIQVLRAKYV